MCAKLKTKREKLSTKQEIDEILKNHGIYLDSSIKDSILNDFIEFFNEKFKPEKHRTPHFKKLESQYKSFYSEVTNGEEAMLTPTSTNSLYMLDIVLKKRHLQRNNDAIWDETTALRQHLIFYNEAIKLDFYKRSFCISMLYNNFDMIRSQLSAMRAKEKINS